MPKHFDRVGVFFARELWIGIVGRVVHLEAAVFAGLRAHQIFGEGFESFFGADMAEHAVGLQRFAAVGGRAHQLQLRVIALGDGAPLDGHERRRALARLLKRLLDVRVGDLGGFDFDFQVLVFAQLELRQHLEDRRGTSAAYPRHSPPAPPAAG